MRQRQRICLQYGAGDGCGFQLVSPSVLPFRIRLRVTNQKIRLSMVERDRVILPVGASSPITWISCPVPSSASKMQILKMCSASFILSVSSKFFFEAVVLRTKQFGRRASLGDRWTTELFNIESHVVPHSRRPHSTTLKARRMR